MHLTIFTIIPSVVVELDELKLIWSQSYVAYAYVLFEKLISDARQIRN